MGKTTYKSLKAGAFAACLLPLGILAWRGSHADLGANPIEFITHATGDWTLRFILITLAITPVRRVSGWHWLIRFRRMFGLYAFFYGLLHFTTYIWLDKFFAWHEMLADIGKRRFITVGFAALVLMVPLAVTSTAGWIRRLGGKRWNQLHRLIYATAVLGVVHYLWLVKADKHRPVEYGAVLAVLLASRVAIWYQGKKKTAVLPPKAAPGRAPALAARFEP